MSDIEQSGVRQRRGHFLEAIQFIRTYVVVDLNAGHGDGQK